MNEDCIPEFEIILDGKILKTISGWDTLETYESNLDEEYISKGYEHIYGLHSGSSGYILFFRESDLTTRTYGWRMKTGLVDMNGNTVYKDDNIRSGRSTDELTLARHYMADKDGNRGWYVRNSDGFDYDITTEEIEKQYVVCHKVFPGIVPENESENLKDATIKRTSELIKAAIDEASSTLGVSRNELLENIVKNITEIKTSVL